MSPRKRVIVSPALAADLIKAGVDLILTPSEPAARAGRIVQ